MVTVTDFLTIEVESCRNSEAMSGNFESNELITPEYVG